MLSSAAVLLAWAAAAAAHGYVESAKINGVDYPFYNPNTDPYTNPPRQLISRRIPGNGPVEDLSLIDTQCNGYTAGGQAGSEPAALHAPAKAGSTVQLYWTLWPESHVGPIITYMAKCPDAGCQNYEPGTDAVWFKVQEAGRQGTSSTWASTAIMTAGAAVTYTIPACIEDGYYLVRHETIALHSAWAYPGAQVYPGCHQLEVSGGGSTAPKGLVSFPGAYKPTDPGITYDAYRAGEYTIPGPAIFKC